MSDSNKRKFGMGMGREKGGPGGLRPEKVVRNKEPRRESLSSGGRILSEAGTGAPVEDCA